MLCRDIGPVDADIILVGEAPGDTEDIQGIPFVGQSGHLLKSMCECSGINYNQCYVTNVSPLKPPNKNFGYFYEDPKRSIPKASLQQQWERLQEKIKSIKPKCVICLGEEALRAVTNLKGIGSWRGTRIEAFNTIVIPTYHPAAILREYNLRCISEMDLRKALKESKGLTYVKPTIITNPNLTEAIEWLKVPSETVSFDIETIGERIRCIGFARRDKDSITAICIPFMRMLQSSSPSFNSSGDGVVQCVRNDVNYWEPHQEEAILEAIAFVLENQSIKKVGQNSIHFDAPIIQREFGISIQNHWMDIMHAWHLLYPSFPKGLDFISSILTDHPNYWSLKDTQNDKSEWEYNAMDCIITLEAYEQIEKELEEFGLSSFYRNQIHPLVFALLEAEQKGVVFDVIEAKKMETRLQAKLDEILKAIKAFASDESFNPNSPKQLQELLYEKLKFPCVYHRKSKKPTTDEDALRRLQKKYPNEPALSSIIEYRKVFKLISTYISPKLDTDGRIRCSYNASGTVTGRIASTKTLRGTGMDLHNIPKGYTRGSESTRHLYIADKGNTFVVGDLKQAEAMAVAWLLLSLGDNTLYDLYQNPSFDIHKWCAANFVYCIPESQVTKAQRQQGGKLANHSGNYMAGPGVMERRALQEGYEGFTYAFCKDILQRRTNGIPGLRVWWDDVRRKISSTRMLTTCFGRHLHFLGRLDDEELRSAIAFEPQSTVGDVTNKLFIELANRGKNSTHPYWPVLTTHDEIVLETKKEYAEIVVREYQQLARIPLKLRPNIPELIIPIELAIGPNWGELKEWKN